MHQDFTNGKTTNGHTNGHPTQNGNGLPSDIGHASLESTSSVHEDSASEMDETIEQDNLLVGFTEACVVCIACSEDKKWLALSNSRRSTYVYSLFDLRVSTSEKLVRA